MLLGTFVNTATVLIGSSAGLLLRWLMGQLSDRAAQTNRLGDKLQTTIMQGLALCTLYMGISGTFRGNNSLIAILSIAIGALIGELLDLDGAMQRLGSWVQKKLSRLPESLGGTTIAEGFVTASLLFCVGAMTIVGALNSGLTGNHDMLFAKSLLDGISSIVFSASLGIGVALSAVVILVYQSAITLAASALAPFLSDAAISEMTCTGSLVIMAISLNMLGVTKIKVMNLLPAIFIPILLIRII